MLTLVLEYSWAFIWGFSGDDRLAIFWNLDRYRRALETCPQAKTSESGHAIFFRRVWATIMTQRRVEHTRVHFRTFLPVAVNNETHGTYSGKGFFQKANLSKLRSTSDRHFRKNPRIFCMSQYIKSISFWVFCFLEWLNFLMKITYEII